MRKIDPHSLISALWLFILLNIIFRDIHQFVLKSHLEMLLTGRFNGTEITEELMLFGALIVQVPIAMVVLSLVLTRRFLLPVTVFAVLASVAAMFGAPPSDMDDMFHLVVELAAMALILRVVWALPSPARVRA